MFQECRLRISNVLRWERVWDRHQEHFKEGLKDRRNETRQASSLNNRL